VALARRASSGGEQFMAGVARLAGPEGGA
jgi:hypothetical protein